MPKSRRSRRSGTRDELVSHKLAVARELLLRDLAERMKSEPILSSPGTVRDWLRLYCAHLEHEVFVVLLLDSRNCLIEAQELFRGTLNQTSVYPREVREARLGAELAAAGVGPQPSFRKQRRKPCRRTAHAESQTGAWR